MRATAIVPVKHFAAAKRRLAGGIDEARRAELIEAMLRDVLVAISESRMLDRVLVVTGDNAAQLQAHDANSLCQ